MKQPVKGSIAKATSTEGYIRHCEAYLANGDWIDDFYGEYQEGRVRWVTIAGRDYGELLQRILGQTNERQRNQRAMETS